jgi:hypothetical protein
MRFGALLAVAVDPNFGCNQFVNLSYTEAASEQPSDAGAGNVLIESSFPN